MSVRLVYNVSGDAVPYLVYTQGCGPLVQVTGRLPNGRTCKCVLRLTLPSQVGSVWTVLHTLNVCYVVEAVEVTYKLLATLGLPEWYKTDVSPRVLAPSDTPEMEFQFLTTISFDPGNLANWTAYADWLQETDDADRQLRGEIMAGWLGPVRLKVKDGVPVIAAERYEVFRERYVERWMGCGT